MTKQHDSEGFTLIEVLVAFAILSLVVIVGFRIFGDGVARVAGVEQRLNEVERARALIGQFQKTGAVPQDPDLLLSWANVNAPAVDWTPLRPALLRVARRSDPDNPIIETIVVSEPRPK